MVGVIFSGAIFGDHSSPISDTTVLSATFTGADLIDHVRTQIYYAATVGRAGLGGAAAARGDSSEFRRSCCSRSAS